MLESCKITVDGIAGNVETLDARVSALELNSGGDISQGAAIIEDISEIKTIADASSATLNSLKTSVDANSTSITAVKTDVSAVKTAVTGVQNTATATNNAVSTINNNVNTANTTLANLSNRIAALETAVANINNKVPNGASRLIMASLIINDGGSYTIPRTTDIGNSFFQNSDAAYAPNKYSENDNAWAYNGPSYAYVKVTAVTADAITVSSRGYNGTIYYNYWA